MFSYYTTAVKIVDDDNLLANPLRLSQVNPEMIAASALHLSDYKSGAIKNPVGVGDGNFILDTGLKNSQKPRKISHFYSIAKNRSVTGILAVWLPHWLPARSINFFAGAAQFESWQN